MRNLAYYVIVTLIGAVGAVAIAWSSCSELCKQMTTMNYEVKVFIDPGLSHPELNAETLTHVEKMRLAAVAARDLIPEKAAGNLRLTAEYQADIDLLISQIMKMGEALAKNDNVAAIRFLNDIKSLKLEGHGKFKPATIN